MTNNSITLIILDSLIDKCQQYNIIVFVPTEQQRRETSQLELNQFIEDEERRIESEHPFYSEENQVNYAEWMLNNRIDNLLNSPWTIDHSVPTGDAALDASDEDEEDYLIPDEEITDCPDTEEYSDDESILNVIDFTEEININDLYELNPNDKYF